MTPEQLEYPALQPLLQKHMEKGRAEGTSLLNWFLENIFRLDEISADDAICDRPNDRGIDGIYVDHNQEEILVLQGKLRQKESSIGDAPLRELAGTLTQLDDAESVQALLDGGGNEDLKNLLIREEVKGLVAKGYSVVGLFVSNQPIDTNGEEFAQQHPAIRIYDRNRISSEFIDVDAEGGIDDDFSFDISYAGFLQVDTGEKVQAVIFPALATELVEMEGIEDGTLFSQNVRQSLGNTKVNKALRQSVSEQPQHKNFLLYHNGVTILAKSLEIGDERLKISQYVVVNGAQSISAFYKSADQLSNDLRVMAKVVKVEDAGLARRITVNSNNQNAIKPRDLKSNNEVQLRLREEFKMVNDGKYDLEIKRGQESRANAEVISNEEAGRLLLAFDLLEPDSCHQVYKLFDEKYADIFARPEVDAFRIIFLHLVMQKILSVMPEIEYRPLSKYGLTRFFLLSVIADLMKKSEEARNIQRNPRVAFENGTVDVICDAIEEILRAVIVDLNYEVQERGEKFDYKGDLKSPNKIRELRQSLLRSYEKDVARKKVRTIDQILGL